MCQQTLTGLYHNEVSVLEELRGWPANHPPQRVHIPTGQGSGLYVCVCVYVCAAGFVLCLCSGRFGESEKKLQFCYFFPPFSASLTLLLSLHRLITLCAVTCNKPDGKAVFAVISVMTICLPLSKLCNKSQTKSNIWLGRSQRGEGTVGRFVDYFPFKLRGHSWLLWSWVRVYCSRTDLGIKFHTRMKGFILLTNDIRGERHTKSIQGDSASAVRLAWRHLFISVHDSGVLPLVSL